MGGIIKKIWLPIKEVLKKIRDFGYRNPITEYIIPVKNQVLLESEPSFSDNTYYIYKEMLKHDYQKKYKIVWIVTSDNIKEKNKRDDIKYFNINKKGIFTKFKLNMLINTSKFIITSNRYYQRKTNRQVIIYLNHGQPLKDCTKLKMNYGNCTASVCLSKFFIEANTRILITPAEKFVVFGSPRNDGLLNKEKDVKKLLGYGNNKIVVWLPTFRRHMNGVRVDSSFDMPLGIPIIYDISKLEKLNEYLKKENIILILKPHFAANVDLIKAKNYSNFKLMYNPDLDDLDITLYDLLGASDGMITDYSSVYFDYLITNKPIGLTLDDYEDYKKETGFAYPYKDVAKGHYIYNDDDLFDFIKNIAKDNDEYKKDRAKIVKMLELDMDGHYSEKVFDYLVREYDF